jgi:hypothetical protein
VESCTETFENEDDLLSHIASCQHTIAAPAEIKRTSADITRTQLFEKLQQPHILTSLPSTPHVTTMSDQPTHPKNLEYMNNQGWALRTRKPPRRCDPEVKSYIEKVLDEEIYGHKFTPEEIVKRIKTARDPNGVKLFTPHQYVEVPQVKNQLKKLVPKRNSVIESGISSLNHQFTSTADSVQKALSSIDNDSNMSVDESVPMAAALPEYSLRTSKIARSYRSILEDEDELPPPLPLKRMKSPTEATCVPCAVVINRLAPTIHCAQPEDSVSLTSEKEKLLLTPVSRMLTDDDDTDKDISDDDDDDDDDRAVEKQRYIQSITHDVIQSFRKF